MKLRDLTKSCVHAGALISVCVMMAVAPPPNQAGQDRPQDEESQHAPHEENRPQRPGKKMLEIRINADALRARLNRSIERSERILKLHTSALAKLDEGASPTEVLAEMKLQGTTRNAMKEQRDPGSRQEKASNLGAPGPERMTPKGRKEMHRFLQNNFPELWKNLEPIAKIDPQSADRLLSRMSPQIREIMLLAETQPDLANLKVKEMHAGLKFVEVSRLYRSTMNDASASDSDRADALAELKSAAAQRFDVQFKAKLHEISMLEARLDELKSSVDGIRDQRGDAIERMLAGATRTRHGQKSRSKSKSRND